MPILESLEPPTSFGGPSSSGASPCVTSVPKSPMDLLKNPFLLPAHLLALNPNLYAAQLAQLQAAQLLFAKQQHSQAGHTNGQDRKRSLEDSHNSHNSAAALGSKAAKYPRSSSPIDGRKEPNSESPLDLSGNKSPECKSDCNPFTPLLPPNILSFFNQMKQPSPDLGGMASLINFPNRPKLSPGPGTSSPPSPPSRSPWQSQWISKTSESTRIEDVFKCVWCKESYQTLEALTSHMKEAKHHSLPYSLAGQPPASSPLRTSISMSSPVSSMSTSPKPSPAPARNILKEQLPIPRKLVRGQDVWIGRADQQTKDILKCMSCGESFRSLEMLTKHMQETQHYKKVISHDQISAWKYPETQQQASKNHVNSVLTCKVCDKGFSSLKELSDHMVRANHYTVEANKMARTPPATPPSAAKDRKKALPVKKLLELERARHELLGGGAGPGKAVNTARDIMETGKLVCERCEDKIPLDFYIAHIQQCVGRPRFINPAKAENDTGEEKPNEQEQKAESSGGSSHSSILGSLEQLVKGNFHGSPNKRQSVTLSPPMSSKGNSIGKFSIQNMFGKAQDCPESPGSSVASPNSSRPGSVGPAASSDKMADSPLDHVNGRRDENENSNNHSDKISASTSPTRNDRNLERNNIDSHKDGGNKAEDNDASKDDNENLEDINEKEMDLGSPPPLVAKSPVGIEKEKKSDNPLAALQMLCDTQKKTPKTPKITENNLSDAGSMLAFSWACNQAMSSDSVIKCPFCDTPFISKGAYRHHLSKMHFTKETGGSAGGGGGVGAGGGGGGGGASTPVPATLRTPSPESREEESLQSKYHKYAQLAKQLSCNQK